MKTSPARKAVDGRVNGVHRLGVVIYISRSDRKLLQEFIASRKAKIANQEARRGGGGGGPAAASLDGAPAPAHDLERGGGKRTLSKLEVFSWLSHDNHLIEASMDDNDHHIGNVFKFIKEESPEEKMSVCFCGPSGLAQTIASAASEHGGVFEFSADHQ